LLIEWQAEAWILKLKQNYANMQDCEIITGEYFKVDGKLHVDYDFVLHTSNCDGSDTESVVSNDNFDGLHPVVC
jgi:hypothetical protein